jgi:type IV pilus assembly protein PilC
MATFFYKAIDKEGNEKEGTVTAVNVNVAINSLQKRGFIISDIKSEEEASGGFNKEITLFQRVKMRDLVIVSRQMATLFEAQVSALRIFRLLSVENENPKLARALGQVAEDLQGGSAISSALEKHPKVFSSFYISMVKAGEESGRLDQTFTFLADYLDRTYELTSKAKNALIYPAFIVVTFFAVMALMLTLVIPKISDILIESGQEIPLYTKFVIGLSDFLTNYGFFILIALAIGGFMLYKFRQTPSGKRSIDQFKLSIPYVGSLYEKLYLARISDNLNTMLGSGIPMVRTLELTKDVVDNEVYKEAIQNAAEQVKGGKSLSSAFQEYEVFPGILIQLIKVGEETGELGNILGTLSKFYQREVKNAVDTLVGMIEPIMIVALAVAIGFLLASVLIPIYNISSAF